jgi:hypothetical protein
LDVQDKEKAEHLPPFILKHLAELKILAVASEDVNSLKHDSPNPLAISGLVYNYLGPGAVCSSQAATKLGAPLDGQRQLVQRLNSLPHEDHSPKHGVSLTKGTFEPSITKTPTVVIGSRAFAFGQGRQRAEAAQLQSNGA